MHLRAMIQTTAVVNGPAIHRFQRRRISYRRIALIRSYYSKVPSLQVPLNKSMKNLSCPDLTKLALQNGGASEEDLQRAPSLGDSIGDTMSLHSEQCTEDELQFAFKNHNLLGTDRYGEDSDSSDCSHLEMMPETPALRSSPAEKSNASDWMTVQLTHLKRLFAELQDDFSEWHPVEIPDQPPKENDESFSLKYTKDTLFRFACVDCSLRAVQHECTKLLQWKSPLQTLLVVAAILHGLWNDCLLTLVFIGVALGLVKNYMSMKGFLGSTTDDFFTTDHKKLGIGMGIDKVPAIMSLNMKIALVDLEEAGGDGQSIGHPRRVSPVLDDPAHGGSHQSARHRPGSKAFVLDYVFVRFPRVRAKYDLAWILWNELPTGPEIEKQARMNKKKEKLAKKKSDQPPLIMINNNASESRSQSPVSFRGDDIDEVLSSIFNIPTSEMCLPGWEQGRKCTLIKKERSLTSAFRNGRLYLTDHYLLFLRYKAQHPKNLTIHLSEISKLEKGKTASWISGDGTSLIVTMKNGEVSHVSAYGACFRRLAGLIL
ncbi:hypothetical protein HPB49_023726 [Dermacentor silvarum]|uniref:Uncharacterized protein n=1 Tax=Dermacentor silvarum TaxID=543639 RepID=A0ACB8CC13_DERSI|nr:hypothetical protein HPB49_023726 [Dermacentor silvarum]